MTCFQSNTVTCGDDVTVLRSEFELAFQVGTLSCPDPCVDVDCVHGVCVVVDIGVAQCSCYDGYTGDFCERREWNVVRE